MVKLLLHCHSHEIYEFYGHISLLEWNSFPEETIHGMQFEVRNCSLPSRSYSSQFQPVKINSSIFQYNGTSITQLKIYCEKVGDFSIAKSHLGVLYDLEFLHLDCPSLMNLPPDLLKDVSGNLMSVVITNSGITEIPPELFQNLTKLKYLDLSFNRIKCIAPDSFLHTDFIEILSMKYNSLEKIDEHLFSSSHSLIELAINSNSMTYLPNSLGKLERMRFLNASHNRIECIMSLSFEGMTSLENLDLSHNKISYLEPYAFRALKNLHSLLLNNNSLGKKMATCSGSMISPSNMPKQNILSDNTFESVQSLDEDIFSNNTMLVIIDISNNVLESLPENIFSSNSYLEILYLQSNMISFLPNKLLVNNYSIHILNLSNNFISELPDLSLQPLEILDISNNKIKYLEKDLIPSSSQLTEFYINSNFIENIPYEILINHKYHLRIINFCNNILTTLPKLYLPELTHFNLAKNKLSVIENGTFHGMRDLKYLNLSYNSIYMINSHPIYLQYQNVESIDLSHNLLDGIDPKWFPIGVYRTVYLKAFNFSGNFHSEFIVRRFREEDNLLNIADMDLSNLNMSRFDILWPNGSPIRLKIYPTAIKEKISGSFKMKILNLSHNHLKLENCNYEWYWEKKIWGCVSVFTLLHELEVLNLSHNEIEVLPLDVRIELPKLQRMDLSYNRIKYLNHNDFLVYKEISYSLEVPDGYNHDRSFPLKPCVKDHLKREAPEGYSIKSHTLLVDLRHNLIEMVDLHENNIEKVPSIYGKNKLFSHAIYLLGHNQFHCNCQIFNLMSYAAEEICPIGELESTIGKKLLLPAKVNIDALSCWRPESVTGKQLAEPETWMHHIMALYAICEIASA